jgi:hypothetical protein
MLMKKKMWSINKHHQHAKKKEKSSFFKKNSKKKRNRLLLLLLYSCCGMLWASVASASPLAANSKLTVRVRAVDDNQRIINRAVMVMVDPVLRRKNSFF